MTFTVAGIYTAKAIGCPTCFYFNMFQGTTWKILKVDNKQSEVGGMEKISCKEIGYHGKPIDELTKEELLSAMKELAEAIIECASHNKKCAEIVNIQKKLECKE